MPALRSTLRIVTWNINSLRLRVKLLERLIDALDPDVICLQETKVPDELFPDAAPGELGFPHVARRGMKGYNGVARSFTTWRRTGARRGIAGTWPCA